jgi:MFS family permease
VTEGADAAPHRRLILAVLSLALCMVVIDNTILSIALPSISSALHTDETGLQWISTSYALVLSGLLLPLAVIGDRFGRKGLLLVGLSVFGVSSAAAAFASDAAHLAVLRGAMGVGGACTMPATLAILGNVFPGAERARAIGVWAGTAGLAAAAGPVIGGFLVARYWWGSVLLVNVPVVAVALVGAALFVPPSRDPSAPPVDGWGSLWWTGALAATLFVIIEGPVRGWVSVPVVAGAAVVAGLVTAFVKRERVAPSPMLAPSTARHPSMLSGATAMTATFFAVFGGQFVLTQWLQGPRGLSALSAGLCFAPQAFGGLVGSVTAPRVAMRIGHPRMATCGLLVLAGGLALTAVGVATDLVPVAVIGFGFAGLGLGSGAASAVELIMSSVPTEQAGTAAGVNETIVEAAGALGVAVFGSMLSAGAAFAAPLPVGALGALGASYVVARVSASSASHASIPARA